MSLWKKFILPIAFLFSIGGLAVANDYYTHGGYPATGSLGSSALMRAELDLITAGFDRLPPFASNANKAVIINAGATGMTTTVGTMALTGNFSIAGAFSTTGAFNTTLVQGATTTLTLPIVSGTLATLAGTETFTNKTLTTPAISNPAFSGTSSGTYTFSGTPTLNGASITNSTINLNSNVLVGTTAQFNSALSDNDFATLAGSESLSNKTLTTPSISNPAFSGTSTGTYTVGGTPTIVGHAVTGSLDLSGASAGQIVFPATQNASANVNTLDDYEEGTWTPSLGGTTTYFLQSGAYVKIGNTVFVQGRLTVNAIGTGSTSVISGLPFTAAAQVAGSCDFSNLALSVTTVVPRVVASGTTITFVSLTAAGTSLAVNAIFGANSAVTFSMFYTI